MAEVRENPAENRFEIWVGDELAGFTVYEQHGTQVVYPHTQIAERFGGQGLATQLIRTALDTERGRGHQVVPVCPFVKSFIDRHPEYR